MTARTQPLGLFDGWQIERTVNLPLIATAVGALVSLTVGWVKMDARMARNEEAITRVEKALDRLTSYNAAVDRLEVRVTTNERAIAALQDDVKALD